MKVFLISLLKIGLKLIYAPLKLFKTKNQIVYLSRQSNEKSIDMKLLESAVAQENSSVVQVFRLKMLGDSFGDKIKYFFHVIGDMYYLATSKVAIVDTYSVAVCCLNHKSDLKIIQMWHALGATKKFGYQALGMKEGREEKFSKAMCMHRNYTYVLAPSKETAKFYMEAFGVLQRQIKICPMPRVDYITDGVSRVSEFYSLNPGMADKKIVLYLPTFRDREPYIAQMLKTEFEDKKNYQLIISTHPLSKVKKDQKFSFNGEFSSFDLMKIADIIITDYSACAFEASLLMKPIYFFVPDYNEYMKERGINVDIREEMPTAVFDEADKLFEAISTNSYDMNMLYAFKEKYVENSKNSNSSVLAKFVLMLMES